MKADMLKFAMTEEERAQVLNWCKTSSGNPYELHTEIFTGYNGTGSELFNQRLTHLSEFAKSYEINVNPDNLPYRAWISCTLHTENGETLYDAYILIDLGNGWCAANRFFLNRPFSFLADYVKALEKATEEYDEIININIVSQDDVLEYFYYNMDPRWNKNKNIDGIVAFACKQLGCSRDEFEKMVNEEVSKFGFGSEYLTA